MRSSLVAVAVLLAVASGCGGDWSNADVEFAAAVPRRADVTVSMPLQSGLSSSGLREGGATSLAIGDPSKTAADTRQTAAGLDTMAGFFVQILEGATRIDPTVRTPQLRIWGPFPNQDAPGWELQLVITRQPVKIDPAGPGEPVEGFYWQIQYRPQGAQEWLQPPLVEGFYEPGEIRRGRGAVGFYAAGLRASGMADEQDLGELGTLNHLTLGYDTRAGQPHTIGMMSRDDLGQQAAVYYQQLDTLSGQLVFDLRTADPAATHIQALSRWTPDYQGRADLAVVEGTAAGAHAVECWDGQQRVVFLSNPWEGLPEGAESSCAFLAP